MRRPPTASFFQLTLSTVICATLACGPLPALRAGDLLRGGAASGATPSGTAPVATSSAASAILPARSAAVDRLARTTQALQAARAFQEAAHAAALAGAANLGRDPLRPTITLPNVPNGLGLGGLQVAPGVPVNLLHPVTGEDASLWTGAKLPSQTTSGGQTTVTVKQTAQQALLTWQTFNLGKETTLKFDQSAGGDNVSQWIAFNKVLDPSGRPSQILGSIQAPGQVYVINTNGIIFGGSSQINVHALVASSLPINDNLVSRGLLNNPDGQFLFTALAQPAGSKGPTPAFTPPALADGLTQPGDVVVQAGAQITTPSNDAHVGGRVALIGPNVSNAGTISTPDGQTILAAGLQVGMTAHTTSDPSLRGLDVFVGSVGSAGAATNTGIVNAPRADVTMVGKDVTQSGIVESSTSVSLNGRIDLLANYDAVSSSGLFTNLPTFLPTSTGTVTIGADSVMRILPEWDSDETIAGALALDSKIVVQGRVIHLGSDATIIAPSASVALDAGAWSLTQANVVDGFIQLGSNPRYSFYHPDDGVAAHDSQIYLDSGATIDVSGSSAIEASVAQNFVSVQLRGSELADSPLQRDGALRGQTVTVDIRDTGTYNGQTWVGTPLANVSGYAALVEHNVGELTTAGGTVALNAGGSVVLQSGSTVDVSGGWINYTGANVGTSQVVSDGHVYDISAATPDRVYDGVWDGTSTRTDTKWGITLTSTNALPSGTHYEAGYTQGAAGGSLAITASSMALAGDLQGATVTGTRQRTTLPTASALSLAFRAQDATYATLPYYAPEATRVIFGAGATAPAAAFALDADGNPTGLTEEQRNKIYLSPDLLTTSGFGQLSVESHEGAIVVPEEVALTAPAGGAVRFNAANISVDGSIVAPGGTIALEADDQSLATLNVLANDPTAPSPTADPSRGLVTLGAQAALSAAGQVFDHRRADVANATTPEPVAGGMVTIKSYSADLADGSAIDVSGGAIIGSTGKASYGDGGSIQILAGQDPSASAVVGGTMALGATLSGYSGAKGGSLAIQAPWIQVGGTARRADTLLFGSDFFNEGGFASFSLTGIGALAADPTGSAAALEIADNTVIAPVTTSLLAVTDATSVSLVPVVREVGVRSPVSLTFGALRLFDSQAGQLVAAGNVVMDKGAVIRTDPKSSVTLTGGSTVWVQGEIDAPGGTIQVKGASKSSDLALTDGDLPTSALTTVLLGPTAVLSAAGTTLLTPDVRGYHTGSVLAGGSVTISGNIAASTGAVIDVSGATDVLDRAPTYTNPNALALGATGSTTGSLLTPTRIDSDAGTITLAGGEMLFSDATLRGFAGGDTAQSGALTVSSGRFVPPGGTAATALDPALLVTQSGTTLAGGIPAIGAAVLAADGTAAAGLGHLSVAEFDAGGFGALTLKGTVAFSGPVALHADRSLVVGTSGVITADADVKLDAPYVALGQAFVAPQSPDDVPLVPFTSGGATLHFDPVYGAGQVTVAASLIDVGTLSFQNIGRVNLLADDGDIRGDGTLDLAGDLYLRAGQIYPPTGVKFTISVSDYLSNDTGAMEFGTVKIDGSGTRALPLSAGGELDIFASMIHQGGVLRAPFGSIKLGTTDPSAVAIDPITGTTVAATQVLSVHSDSVTSVSGVDPTTGEAIVVPYGINLNGTSWIDPSGTDITVSGVAGKSVSLTAGAVNVDAGATIDLNGGGDLYAYRWIAGLGGSADLLASSGSFAIVPGYEADYAPYAAYNDKSSFAGDAGYVNSTLKVGDRIYLDGSTGLPAGVYTLLPARYALLSGAYLVTPKSGTPAAAAAQPDGSTIVAGYRFNDLDATRSGHPLYSAFEVAPQSVVLNRAEYNSYSGNTYLHDQAVANDAVAPRLAIDAGQLVIAATGSMSFQGSVSASAPKGGRGGLVDLSSTSDIVIGGTNGTAPEGTLFLSTDDLNAFAAESLLIGGVRRDTTAGTAVDITTNNLTVDNAGSTLKGSDLILVASDRLTIADGAALASTSGAITADSLVLGDSGTAGSGNGALVRVSADAAATVVRQGVDTSTTPTLAVGAGAKLTGTGLTLDSSATTTLAATADLSGTAVALASGRISFQFDDTLTLPDDAGLVLTGPALTHLASAKSLSFSSYSTVDFYGAGDLGSSSLSLLSLHAADLRGFDVGAGGVALAAQTVRLDNVSAVAAPLAGVTSSAGTLAIAGEVLELGANTQRTEGFDQVAVTASRGLMATESGGLSVDGALTLRAPVITAAGATAAAIAATGDLTLQSTGTAGVTGGKGASLTLTGANVFANSRIALPSGSLLLHATSGDVIVGDQAVARLDVAGTAQTFYDAIRYTDGGRIQLVADAGDVTLGAKAVLDVAAAAGGGDAGMVDVRAGQGRFVSTGTLLGSKGTGGAGGSFALDVGLIDGAVLDGLNAALNTGGFALSRSIRVRTGDVVFGGVAQAHTFDLSADAGSITVTGRIDASGATGGAIALAAHGSVVLAKGAVLDASGDTFDAAGKGGSVALEAGAATDGAVGDSTAQVDLRTGSTIDLSVAAAIPATTITAAAATTIAFPTSTAGNDTITSTVSGTIYLSDGTTVALAANTPTTVAGGHAIKLDADGAVTFAGSAGAGQFTGTLHLRAPQTADGTDVQIAAIDGRIKGASAITVEGYRLFDLTGTDGVISDAVKADVRDNAAAFAGGYDSHDVLQAGHTAAILERLFASQSSALAATATLTPGAEIINRTGDLTLDQSWDLSTYRFGPAADATVAGSGAPGTLTLRAAGNLVFTTGASLSDGFTGADYQAKLLAVGARSWSYRLVAGGDLTAAEFSRLVPLGALGADTGSVLFGRGTGELPVSGDESTKRDDVVPAYFQTIRTGTGDIAIAAGRDIQLLNPLGTIYTAGTRAAAMADFEVPDLGLDGSSRLPTPQYSLAGGNVTLTAQRDIAHYVDVDGVLQADSSRELPTNWLYRRSFVDPATDEFVATRPGGEIASTTWWTDFTNFYEGVAALGGGNVTLNAGNDIANVDAAVATNARMASGTPAASRLVELGGGDLTVRAGRDIDGGVYYVERGDGTLVAGRDITTNSTRSTLNQLDILSFRLRGLEPDATTWLPTTLFVGKGGFALHAGRDVLLGPVVNPFLLPQGANNSLFDKTYFTTYAGTDAVTISSLAGSVTLKTDTAAGDGSLLKWYYSNDFLGENLDAFAAAQPWLRTIENLSAPFATAAVIMPGTLQVAAFSGDINLVGRLNLAPAAQGTLDLLAAGGVNGVQANSVYINTESVSADNPYIWTSSSINVSDADPARLPGVTAPLTLATPATDQFGGGWKDTPVELMASLDLTFAESGSTTGDYAVLQTKQALHDAGVLHADDREPVRIYAADGDISGVTLYAPKQTRVLAGRDITDIALYLQNTSAEDVSVVAAGRDLVAYDPNSALRVGAQIGNNVLDAWTSGNAVPASGSPTAGDIQIGGPGTLEVLAGRNFDLGVGPNNNDGTALGLTSIGNSRNPALPFAGADVVATAGLGAAAGLETSRMDFTAFIDRFLDPASAGSKADRYLTDLGSLLGLTGATRADIWREFNLRPAAEQDRLALQIFYLVLRDAGRDHNLPDSDGYGTYDAGFAAITALFPGKTWDGGISLTSREIKTTNGGDISLLAPGGGLNVGIDISGTQAADQGILTAHGGDIAIFTRDSVSVGTSRIFTLRGGNEVIWSSEGDIAAGASSKTVQSAPPTRVLVDPQSADIQTDLAGLATGGGIGVLATVADVPPGDVDLIAPAGTIDAGDAGIRVSGNINIAAVQVLNAANVQSSGSSSGVPVATTSGVSASLATTTANASAATASAATETARQTRTTAANTEEVPSIISVEVLGYGGSDTADQDGSSDDKDKERKKHDDAGH